MVDCSTGSVSLMPRTTAEGNTLHAIDQRITRNKINHQHEAAVTELPVCNNAWAPPASALSRTCCASSRHFLTVCRVVVLAEALVHFLSQDGLEVARLESFLVHRRQHLRYRVTYATMR